MRTDQVTYNRRRALMVAIVYALLATLVLMAIESHWMFTRVFIALCGGACLLASFCKWLDARGY